MVFFCCCCAEIQSGLIGVGLISMEDRPGILTLDKGNLNYDLEHFLDWELVLLVNDFNDLTPSRLQQHWEVPQSYFGDGGPAAERAIPVLF